MKGRNLSADSRLRGGGGGDSWQKVFHRRSAGPWDKCDDDLGLFKGDSKCLNIEDDFS